MRPREDTLGAEAPRCVRSQTFCGRKSCLKKTKRTINVRLRALTFSRQARPTENFSACKRFTSKKRRNITLRLRTLCFSRQARAAENFLCAKHPLSKRKHRNINVRLRASTLSCQTRPTKGAFCVRKHLLEKKTHRIMTVRLRALTFSRYARRTENLFVRKGSSSKNFFVFGLTTRSLPLCALGAACHCVRLLTKTSFCRRGILSILRAPARGSWSYTLTVSTSLHIWRMCECLVPSTSSIYEDSWKPSLPEA